MSNLVGKDQNGKPIFLGVQDPSTPPVMPRQSSNMECPVCHEFFDYLVGEDTPDGGRMGCEACWRPGKVVRTAEYYDTGKEMV